MAVAILRKTHRSDHLSLEAQHKEQNSVAFCSPAKSLTFSGSMENPLVGKKLVLTSKQHAPKKKWCWATQNQQSQGDASFPGLTSCHGGQWASRRGPGWLEQPRRRWETNRLKEVNIRDSLVDMIYMPAHIYIYELGLDGAHCARGFNRYNKYPLSRHILPLKSSSTLR